MVDNMDGLINSNRLTTSELVYLSEAAKAMKQNTVLYVENYLIGLDYPDFYCCYIHLNDHILSSYRTEGLIFNTKELSEFIKTISTEFDFKLDNNIHTILKTKSNGTLVIDKDFNNRYKTITMNKIYQNTNILNNCILVPERDVTVELSDLYSLHAADGCITIKYRDKFLMTLFSGIVPLLKSDRLYVTIKDDINRKNVFYANFKVKKKKFDVEVLIAYLNPFSFDR